MEFFNSKRFVKIAGPHVFVTGRFLSGFVKTKYTKRKECVIGFGSELGYDTQLGSPLEFMATLGAIFISIKVNKSGAAWTKKMFPRSTLKVWLPIQQKKPHGGEIVVQRLMFIWFPAMGTKFF